MKTLLIIIIASIAICVFCKNTIDYIFNLRALNRTQKDANSPRRVEGGIVFNKKTKKLENAGARIILPFT